MSTECENLVSDAIPDPPRITKLNSSTTNSNNVYTHDEINNQNEIPKNSTENQREESTSKKKSKQSNSKKKSGLTVNSINIVNSSKVRIGSEIHNHFGSKVPPNNVFVNETRPQSFVPKTNDHIDIDLKDLAKLFINTEKLETKHLDLIAEHIGAPWELLGLKLGYSRGQVQQFKINYDSFPIKEVIFQMLLDWTQMYPEKATVCNIIDKLWECNLKEVVKIFSEHNFDE